MDELEKFKREINLVEFAQSKGYQVIKSESSKASTVMKDGAGDKVIVATAEDGHGVYFSVRDDRDNGSVIDFAQKRSGGNLGQVRKELRGWVPGSSSYRPTPAAQRQAKPEASSRDRVQVLAVWSRMQQQPEGGHPYLLNERKLSARTLSDPRFAGHVRIDARGNAAFPHYDQDGLTGYELKNEGFTGFAKGGEKALWHSSNLGTARRVVICESAIDCMSHCQASGDQNSAYVSIGGAMSDKQRELLRDKISAAQGVVIATDRDEAGQKLADEISGLAPAGARVNRSIPGNGKDWNDELKYRQSQSRERSRGGPELGM